MTLALAPYWHALAVVWCCIIAALFALFAGVVMWVAMEDDEGWTFIGGLCVALMAGAWLAGAIAL